MVILGVDVGLSGAIAVLRDGQIETVFDMPAVKTASGKREVSAGALVELLDPFRGTGTRAIVENLAARPGQGVSSVFSFGRSYGLTLGVLAAIGVGVQQVQPAVWKKRARLIGADKSASIGRAIELQPGTARFLTRKGDDGRADAILLALHLAEQIGVIHVPT